MGRRGFVNALPLGNESFAVAGDGSRFFLPASFTDVGPAQHGTFVNQQGVNRLFVGKRLGAPFTGMRTRLNIPLDHEQLNIIRIGPPGHEENGRRVWFGNDGSASAVMGCPKRPFPISQTIVRLTSSLLEESLPCALRAP
jgi:hypothetical protein